MGGNQLDDLIAFLQTEDRVCPQPLHWHKLNEKVGRQIKYFSRKSSHEGEQILKEWRELKPLILNGWIASSAAEKHFRLLEQLRFLARHEFLFDIAERFLRELPLDDWYRENPERKGYFEPYDPIFGLDEG